MNVSEMEAPRWPPWATATFVGLLLLLCTVHVVDKVIGCVIGRSVRSQSAQGARTATDSAGGEDGRDIELQRFRRQYLAVYGLVMFADWLQGTHMYSLYQVRPSSGAWRRVGEALTLVLWTAELRAGRRHALLDRIPVVRCLRRRRWPRRRRLRQAQRVLGVLCTRGAWASLVLRCSHRSEGTD